MQSVHEGKCKKDMLYIASGTSLIDSDILFARTVEVNGRVLQL